MKINVIFVLVLSLLLILTEARYRQRGGMRIGGRGGGYSIISCVSDCDKKKAAHKQACFNCCNAVYGGGKGGFMKNCVNAY